VRRLLAGIAATLLALLPASASAAVPTHTELLGRSAGGRPIRIVVRGAAGATANVLVVGVIHGNESAGVPIVRRLARSTPPAGARYWLLPALNVDGVARGTRQDARGVDLNRNFPFGWRGSGHPFDTYYPGRTRASERETRIAMALVRRIRPDATVWYHQHMDIVVRPPLPWRQRLAQRYATLTHMRMRAYPGPPLFGTASSWHQAEQPRSLALVVELPAGTLPARAVVRHAAAVRLVAASLSSR
jgi:protein MpaA